MKTSATRLSWFVKLAVLLGIFLICFVLGSLIVAAALPPDVFTEPGPVPTAIAVALIATAHVMVVTLLVAGSRWRGWKLAVPTSLAYYGVITVLPQMETWYFLTERTVPPSLLPRLFLMGIPPAFVFVPCSVWVLGKGSREIGFKKTPPRVFRFSCWWQGAVLLAFIYVVLYWTAGYFIAWQNPQLREFYGHPGPPQPFFSHTLQTLRERPFFWVFQLIRGILWVACATPIVYGSRWGLGATALSVALFFSLPQNLMLLLPNPLMPSASVRLTHLVETAVSSFVFGILVTVVLAGFPKPPRRE
ncbi:MAG: hypothetical protein WHT09_11520 [Thermogutta sp.]